MWTAAIKLTLAEETDPVYSTQDILRSAVASMIVKDATRGDTDSRVKLKRV